MGMRNMPEDSMRHPEHCIILNGNHTAEVDSATHRIGLGDKPRFTEQRGIWMVRLGQQGVLVPRKQVPQHGVGLVCKQHKVRCGLRMCHQPSVCELR